MLDWLTPAERRGASVLVVILLVGAVSDAWRAHRSGSRPPPARPPLAAGPVPPETSAATPAGAPTGAAVESRLDVNRATAADLEALPGIGPVLARRIIEHRAARGAFLRVEDLLGVRGVGPKLFERLAPRLRVGPGPAAERTPPFVQSAHRAVGRRADSTSVPLPRSR